jgi:hypothetical protein
MDNGRKPIAPIPKRVNSNNIKLPFSLFNCDSKSPVEIEDVKLNPFLRNNTVGFDREFDEFRKECEEQEDIKRASNEIFKILKSSESSDLEHLTTMSSSSSEDGSGKRLKPVPRQSNPLLRNFEKNVKQVHISNSQFYSKAE